jgi:hypothetical protein
MTNQSAFLAEMLATAVVIIDGEANSPGSGIVLTDLSPPDLLLEVISFLWNDPPSIAALQSTCRTIRGAIPRHLIRQHFQSVVLLCEQEPQHKTDSCCCCCCFCNEPLKYPVQLADCPHKACAACFVQNYEANNAYHPGGCPCGRCQTSIRNKPHAIGSNYDSRKADIRAFWLLTQEQYQARHERHHALFHAGTRALPRNDPIGGTGFMGNFDGVPTIELTTALNLSRFVSVLPQGDREIWITHCPAHCNYSGFPAGSGPPHRICRILGGEDFFEKISEQDVLLITVQGTDVCDPAHWERRLVGWEHLAG